MNERCDRCGELVSGEALAKGWPVPVDADNYVCPSCLDGFCLKCGDVLPGDVDCSYCPECENDD